MSHVPIVTMTRIMVDDIHMIPWYISIIPVIVSLIGSYYTGNKKWYGFAISLCVQVVWFGYGVFTHQWPFILSPFVYAMMHYRNMQKWRRDAIREHMCVQTQYVSRASSIMEADTLVYPVFPAIIDGDVVMNAKPKVIDNDNDNDNDIVHCGDKVIAHITGVVDVVYDGTIVLNVIDAHGDTYHVTFDVNAAGVSLSGPYNDDDEINNYESTPPSPPGIQIRYITRS